MYASVVLDWVVVAFALPTPTNPPEELLTVARALVTESAVTETSPVVETDDEATYAVTVAESVAIERLSADPTRPAPEPVALAVETASPGGGESVASERPPGPTIRWLASGTAPVMSMRN